MNVTLRMSNPSHLPVSLELIGGAWAVCASASGIKPACFCLCSENSLLPTSNIQKHPKRSTSWEIPSSVELIYHPICPFPAQNFQALHQPDPGRATVSKKGSGHRRSRCCRRSYRPNRPPEWAWRTLGAPVASFPAAGRASHASPGMVGWGWLRGGAPKRYICWLINQLITGGATL